MKFLALINWLCLILCRLSGLSSCTSYPMPEPCYGPACANPPYTLDYQDMTVIKRVSDGMYFRFAKSNATGQGLSVATAKTLRGTWEFNYTVLGQDLEDSLAAVRAAVRLWAPEVHYANGLYYLYYAINTIDFIFDLCVATSPSMDHGTWRDHGSMGVPISKTTPSQSYVRLDGNMLANSTDPSGIATQPYMVFGSSQWGLYGFPVCSNLTTIAADAKITKIIEDQTNAPVASGNRTEGAFQLQNGAYTYLFYSRGDCCPPNNYSRSTVYRIQVCRSSKGPTGPYFDANGINCLTGGQSREGTNVLYSHGTDNTVFAPGSPGIINDPDEGGLVMYYQYRNATDWASPGLRFGFNYLEFDDDDWPVLVAKRTPKM